MAKIRITKKFEFEAGHALYGYDGKCKNIHGHSYKLWVTVIGTPIENIENVKNKMEWLLILEILRKLLMNIL